MADPGRRAFFRAFGRQAVSAVGQVAGMADAVGRTSGSIAGELLGLDRPAPRPAPEFARSGRSSEPVVSTAPPAGEDVFRSAYRVTDDEVVLLDQREVPEALTEVSARRGSDVAYYLRLGVARGGPLMAQVAAYGLALTARERAGQPSERLEQELRRTERALAEARPSSRLPAWALARVRSGAGEAGPEELAVAMRAEADRIADDIAHWHSTIATSLASVVESAVTERAADAADEPATVLLHGSQGALAGGLVGTGLAALAELRARGHEPRIFLTEGRPAMDGARLASWELRQAGFAHRIIPDGAVGWLLDHEPLDAVLLAAEWVAANGDVGAVIGSRVVAEAAHAARASRGHGPRVLVSGVAATLDPDTPDGATIPGELRPARELTLYLSDVPIRAGDALVPAADVVPARYVDHRITEAGDAHETVA